MIISMSEKMHMDPVYVCMLASFMAYKDGDNEAQDKLHQYNSNWRKCLDTDRDVNNHNYRGVAVCNDKLRMVVIGHRGTEPGHIDTWLDTNKKLVEDGEIPRSYYAAEKFSKDVRDIFEGYEFIEVGHSLGGMYAALLGHRFDCICIGFDSPSVGAVLTNKYKRKDVRDAELNEYLFTNYVSAPNLVNTSGSRRYGRWIRLFTPFYNETDKTVSEVSNSYWNPVASVFKHTFSYTPRCHDKRMLVGAFDPVWGEPYLKADVIAWPSRMDYLKWFVKTSMSITYLKELWMNEVSQRNIRYESALSSCPNYRLSTFIIPRFYSESPTEHEERELARYRQSCLRRFDIFYRSEYECRSELEKLLHVNGSDDCSETKAYVPVSIELLSVSRSQYK